MHIGLIGCGRISQAYLEALKEIPDIQLTAALDTSQEALENVKKFTNCTCYTDLGAFIKHPKLGSAIICAPPAYHKSIACKLMDNGISVLCEKPLAISVEEGEAMMASAKKNKVTLMMASKFRFVDDIIETKELIAKDALGPLHIYQNNFCSNLDLTNRWNANAAISGGGVFIDNGSHSLDLVEYLIGPIAKISVTEGPRKANLPVEDNVRVAFVTKNRINGTIHLSWSLGTHSDPYLEVYGEEGAIKLGWKHSFHQKNGTWHPFGRGYQKIEAFKRQLLHFKEAIEHQATLSEAGLTSLKLIMAGYDSLKRGEWVSV